MSLDAQYKPFSPKGSKYFYNPDITAKVKHISLDLKIDFDAETVNGVCKTRVSFFQDEITTLTINAVQMEIYGVKIDSKEIEYEYDGEIITLNLNSPSNVDQEIEIEINYKLEKPEAGITFVKPTDYYPDKPTQLWTQGESEQSRYWYPCFDFPLQICTTEIKVTVPDIFTTVSNGEIVSQDTKDGLRTDHWIQQDPHPSYLMALAVGEFTEIKDKYKDLPVHYYVQKELDQNLELNGKKTPKMIEFFEQKFGVTYPWKKYHQTWLHDYIWGGMENTSTTFNTERALVDEKASQDFNFGEILVAHELAHQWFGDYIVIEHWSELWVKEGAATYSEYLWYEKEYGWEEFQNYKLTEIEEYLDEDKHNYRRPTVTNLYSDPEDIYDRHSYSKGGLIYNMIRAKLGDRLFEKSLQKFLSDNKHQNVNSTQFLQAITAASGKNLKPIFDQYIYRGGHPDFKVSFNWDNEYKIAKITIVQTQAKNDDDLESLFDLEIPVSFCIVDNKEVSSIDLKFRISKKEQSFYTPLDQKPDFISFDTNNDTLKTVELDYGVTELSNQLKSDPDPISRIYAIEAISKKANIQTIKTLKEAYETEKFWAVRAKIIEKLGSIKLDQARETIVTAFEDTEPRVRKSAVVALAQTKSQENYDLIYKKIESGDDSYFTEAQCLKSLGEIAYYLGGEYENKTIKTLEETLQTKSGWNEVVRSGAILGLGMLKDSVVAAQKIMEYSQLGIPQSLRFTAITTLGAVSKVQEKKVVEQIVDLLSDYAKEDYIMAEKAVIGALSQIESVKALSILNYIADKTKHGRMKNLAEKAAKKASQSLPTRKSIAEIRLEIEEIKKENTKLKSRLEEVEAKTKKTTSESN